MPRAWSKWRRESAPRSNALNSRVSSSDIVSLREGRPYHTNRCGFRRARMRRKIGHAHPPSMRQSLLAVLALALALPLSAQQRPRLKVYISSDMEGIAGLVSSSQVTGGERDYGVGRRLMIAETNAAIAAAFDAGATEVLVNDSQDRKSVV